MPPLSDRHMSKILESTSIKDRTVIEIMQEQNLSHSTAYKKTQQLLKFGFLLDINQKLIMAKKLPITKVDLVHWIFVMKGYLITG